jgi:hypothetical protein
MLAKVLNWKRWERRYAYRDLQISET